MELHMQTDVIEILETKQKLEKPSQFVWRVRCIALCILVCECVCMCECRMFKKRKSGYGMHFRFTIGQKYHDAMQLKLEWHKPWTMDKYSKFCQLFWSPGVQIKNSCSEYM